ncbi:unnamed protein product [Heterobilharzia americana]|nr:unnamed protein product [Heterobilharzia americana]
MKFDWDKQTNDIESITTSIEENYFNLNIPVAIKVLSDSADPQTNKELLEEAKVMATVDHPCCVRFLALCLTSKLQLITQFLPLGSLLEFVKTQWDTVEVSSLFQWSEQIASGMAYLSTRGIIHRDLAARNVLVQSKGQVQITDFGLAKCLDTTNSEYHASGGRMPIKWLAIECIQDRIFSSKSDVWAYGITLWEMCTFGQRPYENIHAKDLLDFLEKGNRLPQPETTSLDFYCLMLQCWDVDPNFRPTFKEICTVLCEMKTTPSRYLFIVPELRLHNSATSQQTSSSQSAFEFLSDCLTDTTIPPLPPPKQSIPNHNYEQANQIVGQNSDFIDYIEYTQMHYDWLKNLYVNSKTNLFPECVKTLLDNYNNYLIGININDSSNTNGNSKYEDNYIRFQNQVFSKYRNKSIHENIETNENTCSNKEYADVHRNSLSRQKEHTNIKDNKESLEYLEVKPESFERNPTLFNVKRGISIFDKDQVQDSDNR